MRGKPTSQGDYRPADLTRAISACLQVAEGLGEELMAQLTVVGGLAPYLLVPSDRLPPQTRHVGTLDLDLAVAVASCQELDIYERISRRLIASGFSPEKNREGTKPPTPRDEPEGHFHKSPSGSKSAHPAAHATASPQEGREG